MVQYITLYWWNKRAGHVLIGRTDWRADWLQYSLLFLKSRIIFLICVGSRRLWVRWVGEWLSARISANQSSPCGSWSELRIILALSNRDLRFLGVICARTRILFSLLRRVHRIPDNLRLECHVPFVDCERLNFLELFCYVDGAFGGGLLGGSTLLPCLSFVIKYLSKIGLHLLFYRASLALIQNWHLNYSLWGVFRYFVGVVVAGSKRIQLLQTEKICISCSFIIRNSLRFVIEVSPSNESPTIVSIRLSRLTSLVILV